MSFTTPAGSVAPMVNSISPSGTVEATSIVTTDAPTSNPGTITGLGSNVPVTPAGGSINVRSTFPSKPSSE